MTPKAEVQGSRFDLLKWLVVVALVVVGVVGNIKHKTLADGPNPTVYAPMAQATAVWVPYVRSNFTFVVRTRSEPEGLITAVRRALRSADVSAPPATVRIMNQFVASALGPSRFSAEITILFAGTALLLSAMGLYSVVAYLVSLRTGEFGVRIALGAGVGDILRIVMQNGFQLVVTGECVGLPVAAVVAHAISNNLYQTNAADLSIYMWVCASVVSLSALALYIPARRATRIDPAITLRA